MEKEWINNIDSSQLPDQLSRVLKEFLTRFDALPALPNTTNPHYMQRLLHILVDDVCTEERVAHLWWQMTLYMAKMWAVDRAETGRPVIKTIEKLSPLLAQHFPNDDSEVTLKEVDEKNLFGVMMLSETLSEPKRYFVANNSISIAQAHFAKNAWFRAIYAGRTPVGFVMLSVNEDEGNYFVWRFMIGEPYHGRGYGRKAMEAIKEHVRALPRAKELLLSYGQGSGSPEGFYKKLGFEPTGEVHGGEIVAKISL
jgi:diamine N-acetyltransferase